ncbi:MAG: hypothetical protein ACE366_00260 [Bradymonadia bacterium]
MKRLHDWAEDNARKTCPRPVLHGQPTPGNGEEALLDAISHDGPNAQCYEALKSVREKQPKTSYSVSDISLTDRLSADERSKVLAACASVPDQITRFAAYEQMCNPIMQGRRSARTDNTRSQAIQLAQATALHGRHLATKDPTAALKLLLDGVRVQHDLERGGRPFLTAALSTHATRSLGAAITVVLDDPRLQTADLVEAERMIDVLLDTLPPVGGVAIDERRDVAYSIAFIEDQPANQPSKPGVADIKPDRWPFLMYSDESAELHTRLCPHEATLEACLSGLGDAAKLYDEIASRRDKAVLEAGASTPARYIEKRRGALRRLNELTSPDINWLRQIARREVILRALKLQAATHRLAGGNGRCPQGDARNSDTRTALMRIPSIGDTLQVRPRDDQATGAWFYLPGQLLGDDAVDKMVVGGIRCAPESALGAPQ